MKNVLAILLAMIMMVSLSCHAFAVPMEGSAVEAPNATVTYRFAEESRSNGVLDETRTINVSEEAVGPAVITQTTTNYSVTFTKTFTATIRGVITAAVGLSSTITDTSSYEFTVDAGKVGIVKYTPRIVTVTGEVQTWAQPGGMVSSEDVTAYYAVKPGRFFLEQWTE